MKGTQPSLLGQTTKLLNSVIEVNNKGTQYSLLGLVMHNACFFSSKRVLACTKRYNTCSTRFVPLPMYGFLANTFIPIVFWVYLT